MNLPNVEDNAHIMNLINKEFHVLRAQSVLWKRYDSDVVFRLFSVTIDKNGNPMVNYAPDLSAIVDAMYTRTKADFCENFYPYKVN